MYCPIQCSRRVAENRAWCVKECYEKIWAKPYKSSAVKSRMIGIPVPGTTSLPDDDSCKNGEDNWYERTPYRKIPYSSHENGDKPSWCSKRFPWIQVTWCTILDVHDGGSFVTCVSFSSLLLSPTNSASAVRSAVIDASFLNHAISRFLLRQFRPLAYLSFSFLFFSFRVTCLYLLQLQ